MKEKIEIPFEIFENVEFFLNKVYKINSFNDGIHYLNNNPKLPILTINRILNCMFLVFIDDNDFPDKTYIQLFQKCYNEIHEHHLNDKDIKNTIMKYKHKNNNKMLETIFNERLK